MEKPTTHQFVLIFILFSNVFGVFIDCYRFEPNTITIKSFSACKDDEKNAVRFKPNITLISRNKYEVNGEITIRQPVSGPYQVLRESTSFRGESFNKFRNVSNFQFQLIPKRCDFNLTQCETFDTITIRDICKVLDMGDQIWTDFMAHTQPKAKCPFKMNSIRVINATVDLGYIANLPLDGYAWIFDFKSFQPVAKTRYKKRLLYCGMSEVIIKNKSIKN